MLLKRSKYQFAILTRNEKGSCEGLEADEAEARAVLKSCQVAGLFPNTKCIIESDCKMIVKTSNRETVEWLGKPQLDHGN